MKNLFRHFFWRSNKSYGNCLIALAKENTYFESEKMSQKIFSCFNGRKFPIGILSLKIHGDWRKVMNAMWKRVEDIHRNSSWNGSRSSIGIKWKMEITRLQTKNSNFSIRFDRKISKYWNLAINFWFGSCGMSNGMAL